MLARLFWKFFVSCAVVNLVAIMALALLGREHEGFLSRVAVFTLVFLPVLMLMTWWAVSRSLRPLEALADAARRMANHNYDEPVYVSVRDDFRQLANDFNRIRVDNAARNAEMNRLSTVLTRMTDGVIALDEAQRIQFANEAAGQLLGFIPEDVQGRPLLEAVRHNKLHELVVRLLASKRQEEIEIKWGDDNLRNLLVHAKAFSEGEATGPTVAIVMMIYNLSEVTRLDAMRRDFVANVSHELKTPLSSIKAYAETLSSGAINDEENRDRFVQQIEEQADRLHQLIADLLSLARIEQGNPLFELKRIPLARVVDLCIREQQRAAEQKNIDLSMVPSDQSVWVEVDEDGLRQILINLIDNAIKYTPEGGVVTVSWTQEDSEIALVIEDNGIGIPDDMRERVFERFFRVDKARSRELGGTGLGLAIVKHLTQSFGGSVGVESSTGGGSRFTVRFPPHVTIE